jgi:cytochrome c-type biogenesis protein CcmF
MWQSLPEFGTGVLYAVLVVAAYTFAVSLYAGRTGRPRHLEAARLGAYGTVATIALGVLVLAYAFVTHDFRIRYVARYSDRSMSTAYLFTALWGGQDGSLLWWMFLLSIYTGACVKWLKGRYKELQPYVIATLMSIIGFFSLVMLFAANPFWTSVSGVRLDGEGLNPLLQNFYMIIHPPSLYTGFVGCSVPFAFAVAALVTGRLDNEWIIGVRKWMLFAWMFLSIGNGLGMLWAYEELGWGGYWAWDPVENAACLPWFTATAYLHSTMTQERRGMFKVWNVFLIGLTFFLTIFGTFLTRSGMIASVHSFAQSDIGKYFVYYMAFLAASSLGLLVWRLPRLRAEGRIESLASREATFVVNNWALLGMMTFIAVATVFPKISELWQEPVTVGPAFYNRWIVPAGLLVIALMGAGPVIGWRKTSVAAMKRGFILPIVAAVLAAGLHFVIGPSLGFPALVPGTQIYAGALGSALKHLGSVLPVVSVSLVAFNIAVVIQEYVRGIMARRNGNPDESIPTALLRLVSKSKRRYGGYIVHVGIAIMVFGFTGAAWNVDKETSMRPGETYQVGGYALTYKGPRMELDPTKRMIFADVDVVKNGKPVGTVSPAKFIYRKMPESPTSEVSMLHTLRDDLYVVLGTANPETKVATFQIHVNPLVSFIWTGLLVLIFGSFVAMWPEAVLGSVSAWSVARSLAGVATSVLFGISLAALPAKAYAQSSSSSSLHAGTVEMHSQEEREVFGMLLCQCGSCARLPLSNCVCSDAEAERAEVRGALANGEKPEQIYAGYVAKYGTAALAVPPNQGKLRFIWAAPVGLGLAGALGAYAMLRRLKQKGDAHEVDHRAEVVADAKASAAHLDRDEKSSKRGDADKTDDYDRRLDDELDALEDGNK